MGVGTLPKSQLQVVRNFWRESMTGVCVCWGPSHTGCEWSAVTSGARVWGQLHPGTETAQSLCISVHPRGHTSGITSVSAHAHPQPNHAVNARSTTGQCACTRSCVCVWWSLHSPDWVSWRSSWRRRLMVMIRSLKMFLTLSVSPMSSLCFVLSPLSLFTPTAKDPYQYLS